MKQSFTLQPFEPDDLLLSINGLVEYQQGLLEVHYALQGDLTQVLFPDAIDMPGRKFALWEATCLEFFVAIVGRADYWEFNLAPNGNWQVFHLNDYREGLKDEAAINYLPFGVKRDEQELQLDLSIDLTCLFPPDTKLEMAVTAVIQASSSEEYSYWSLQHGGEMADFHRRADFVIKLG
jgi:hypothetical protein